ncbi:MAG TPA: DUF2852 domain-containing protein [Beijerinckiaceae bacterium]|jgi:hypothetical protein|nr:DUF2852 domain-containing protein [Beijerinckiaceae bacterium]
MSYASTAGATSGVVDKSCASPRRAWEIAGIILGFVFVWPVALAYLVWKLVGYPMPAEWRSTLERTFVRPFEGSFRAAAPFGGTGNAAFDEYRRDELRRLEEERRRLDEEAKAFAAFVEELKRAKDREEFDAFMARRRGGTSA